MSWIAGIDFSSWAIDVVLIDENHIERPEWHRTELTGGNAFDRTRSVDNGVTSAWWDDVLAIGIEDPRGKNAGALYRIQGAVLANLPTSTLVTPWIPSQWRKAVGLPGNCTKERVKLFVHDDMNADPWWPQDACDAYCIALATRSALRVGATDTGQTAA